MDTAEMRMSKCVCIWCGLELGRSHKHKILHGSERSGRSDVTMEIASVIVEEGYCINSFRSCKLKVTLAEKKKKQNQ